MPETSPQHSVNDNHLWSFASLRNAFRAVQAKAARGGIDRRSVEQYAGNLPGNLEALRSRLANAAYVPDPYEQYAVPKDDGSKRILSLATVEDKIVQFVVKEHLETKTKRLFADCSYAYRWGKGHAKAIGRVSHHLSRSPVVLVCDIDNFFDSINHAILREQLVHLTLTAQTMQLLMLWVTTGAIRKGRLIKRLRGIAQGGIVSPILSNIYLTPFDKYMISLGHPYVRYADNFIVLATDRAILADVFTQGSSYLEKQLSLRLNENLPLISTHEQGFDFLGIHFQGGRRTIAPRKFDKARAEITEVVSRSRAEPFEGFKKRWDSTLEGWKRYYGPYDVKEQFAILQEGLTQSLVAELVRRHQMMEFESFHKLEESLRLLKPLVEDAQGWHEYVLNRVKESIATEVRQTKSQQTRVQKVRAARNRRFIHLHVGERDLLVSSPGSFLGKHQGRFQVKSAGTVLQECSARTLQGILLGARGVALSTDAIKLCVEKNIQLAIVDAVGRPIAYVAGNAWPQFAISAAQVEASANERGATLALQFASAKVRNQVSLMRYYGKYHTKRDHTFSATLNEELPRMEEALHRMAKISFVSPHEYRSVLLGLEGQSAAAYWRCVRALIGPSWQFDQREHQGATNIVNKMLNYGYGVLSARVFECITRRGLNPMISFLHTPRTDTPTLVFDVMEQFRPTLVDGVIITILLRKEEVRTDHELLASAARDKLAKRIMAKFRTEFGYRGKRQTPEEILNNQLVTLIEFLQGKTKRFKPFTAKW